MSTTHVGLVAFQTILGKEIRRFARIWMQTILPPAITMSLYLVIFGNLIGTRVGEMGGYPYMDFIAPGVIMMAVITSSYSNVVSSFFGARYQRFIEEMLISPTPHAVILLGYVGGGVARGLAVGLVVTTVATLLADLKVHNLLVTVLVVFLTSVLFSLAGFINAIYAKNFDDIAIVPTFVLTPLIYLGGVFYSIALLPDPWQTLSRFNPILYMVNGFRYGILGVSDIPVFGALAAIAVFVVGLFVFSLRLLNRGVGIRT
ncbi:MAG: ABC transporter permease [Gammaproteobacteria bacterium]|jgi:ABC-2 type transport system permease protein|nr:ABC transporter permease [Gammaproteobacteria bacterium]